MNYLIALIVMPLLMVTWVLVQRWAGVDEDEEPMGACVGCTCGKGLAGCERRSD